MRRRLMLVAAATTSMVVIAFVLPLAALVRTLAEERGLSAAHEVAEELALYLAQGDPELVTAALSTARVSDAGEVTVVFPDGTTVGEDDGIEPARLERARTGESFQTRTDEGMAVAIPVGGPTSDVPAVVFVDIESERLREGVAESWAVLGGLGVVMIVGAVVVADRLGRRITRPVAEVAETARALSAGERDTRAPVAGPPEIADVAHALNGLADAIDDLLAAEREAAADLSHRLRTPMTALRLDLESLDDGPTRERLTSDLARLEEAVDRLIRHARSGAGSRGPADLGTTVRERVAFWTPLAEDENRNVDVDVPDMDVPVDVADEDLAAAIDALVGNVLTHTPTGTGFAVSVSADDGIGELSVEDAGPGFASAEVLDRGYSDAGSTGLGLDICRRLAEEAGGDLQLDRSASGGARVRMRFPLASRP